MKAYRAFGEDGLKRSRAQQTYSFEFKRSAVECYLSTEASYQDVALAHGLNNPSMLVRWTKEYRSGGVDALKPKPKGSEFKYWLRDSDGKPVTHKLYLDPYMDLFNSEIVSFHIGKTPSAEGIQSALEEAIRVTADCSY